MNTQEFLQHVESNSEPDVQWRPSIQALWYAEKGDWNLAHETCQMGDEQEGAWVHANLHRQEGDDYNARHWYRRAGRPESSLPIEEERREILSRLLEK